MKKTKLFKSLLVAAGLCVGASAWAVTVTETYDFGGFITANGAPGMTLGSTVVATQSGTSEYTGGDLYQLQNPTSNGQTLELNDRFAIDYGANAGVQIRFMWRSSSNAYQHGLAGNWNNKGTANTACHLSVLNLKVGDKITFTYAIQSGRAAEPYLCKSGIVTGVDADAYLASGTEYSIVTAGNLDIYFKNNNFAVSKIVIVTEKEGDETMGAPSIDVTGINGGTRTITITPGVGDGGSAATATYYTLDGTDPSSSNGTAYTEPFSITETTTVKAVSYLNETIGTIQEKQIEAGTTITLNAPSVFVSGMVANGEAFNATFNASNDQSHVLLAPTATQTATFTPEGGEATAVTLPFTVTEKGTLTVTASAEGYNSASIDYVVYASYEQEWQSADFSSLVGVEAVEAAMGGTWTLSDGHGRWASWNKDKDGTYNFYTTSTDGKYQNFNKRVNFRDVVVLAEGMGLGRNVTGGEPISITETVADDIVAFEIYNGYGNDINKGTNTFMSYVLSDGTNNPSLSSTNGALLVQATVYVPTKYTSLSIVGDFSENGWDVTKGIAMTRDADNFHLWKAVVNNYVISAKNYEYKAYAIGNDEWMGKADGSNQNFNFNVEDYGEGIYNLTFTANTVSKTVEMVAEKQITGTIYYVNTWDWEYVNAWVWNDSKNFTGGSWPGQRMTKTDEKIDGHDVYVWNTYDLDTPTKVMFNYNGDANKTGEFAYENDATYSYNGTSTVTKTISAAGYATYCSDNALDFTGTGLTAYIAKIGTDNKVTFAPVTKVPAKTGVLLKGDARDYTINTTTSTNLDDVTDNKFVGVTTTGTAPIGSFVLLNGSAGVGFYKTNNEFTVGANTAYLPALASNARFIGFDFDDNTTTAIEGVATVKMNNGEIFNLQGQRVTKATKGLYIINGKKVMVK